jgi:hypothetical protein
MDIVAIIKERIADLEKKLPTSWNPKAVQAALDQNKKLLEEITRKK